MKPWRIWPEWPSSFFLQAHAAIQVSFSKLYPGNHSSIESSEVNTLDDSLAPAIDPAEVGIFCSDPAFLDEASRSVSLNPRSFVSSSFPFGHNTSYGFSWSCLWRRFSSFPASGVLLLKPIQIVSWFLFLFAKLTCRFPFSSMFGDFGDFVRKVFVKSFRSKVPLLQNC